MDKINLTGKLSKYPFLRILVCLILGICIGNLLYCNAKEVGYAVIITCLAFACVSFVIYRFFPSYCYRWLFGSGIFFFFIFTGSGLSFIYQSKSFYKWEDDSKVYYTRLMEKPVEKANSFACTVYVSALMDSLGYHSIGKKVLLYFPKDTIIDTWNAGNTLLFYGKIHPPKNKGNPGEFDYAKYLNYQGVAGTGVVYHGNYCIKDKDSSVNLKQIALAYREKILRLYKRSGFGGEEFAVLSALTLGYKGELNDEIREAYSVAGVSHVLALSGLHIGLLYFLIVSLLNLCMGNNSFRIIKGGILLSALWSFAFISGLSPSVVRSVIMFSFIVLARMCNFRAVTLNTVCIAAFLMLLYNPFYLYDISFQLSFLAVISIILLFPWLERKLVIKNQFLKKVWQLAAVSLAAQIGTLPVVLYNFSVFPVYSLLANIPVIFLVTLILYLSIIFLLIGFIPVAQAFFADILVIMLRILNRIISFIESLPVSSIDNIHCMQIDIWAYYFILLLFLLKGKTGKRIQIWSSAFIISFLCVSHGIEYNLSSVKHPSIFFYNFPSCPAVHYIASGESSYLQLSKDSLNSNLKLVTEGVMKQKRLADPFLIPLDYENEYIWTHNGITRFAEYTICLVNDNRWENKVTQTPLLIDYLYVCKGYKGKLEDCVSVFRIRKVVLDASLGEYRLNLLKSECRRRGLDYISLMDKGSFEVKI